MTADKPAPRTPTPGEFLTTRWSVVLEAGGGDEAAARGALEILCRNYWQPLYAWVRRSGHSPADAQDIVQGFFAQLLERHALGRVGPEKGRFRSFLLASLRYYMADVKDKARAAKRGGGQAVLSLDEESAEAAYAREAADETTPETLYERRWAARVLEQAQARLRAECESTGKGDVYLAVGPEADAGRAPLHELAARLGTTEGALKVAAWRLRQRYQQLIRDEVAQTVARPAEVDEEIRHLMAVLAGR